MVIPSDEKNFETRLIEANTNPCLEESNALLKAYLPRMADDMLKIVLDPLFGMQSAATAQRSQQKDGDVQSVGDIQSVYPVEGHGDTDNMWKLIVSPTR